MDGELWRDLPPSAPLCKTCKVRSAARHPVVGWWSMCPVCRQRTRTSREERARGIVRRRRRSEPRTTVCLTCRELLTIRYRVSWCSVDCYKSLRRSLYQRNRDEVLAALGGICTCTGDECWHVGACGITAADLLEVEHTKNDGALVRRRIDGRSRTYKSVGGTWSRYKRALRVPDHGMVLLCANCHRRAEAQKRRAARNGLPPNEVSRTL